MTIWSNLKNQIYHMQHQYMLFLEDDRLATLSRQVSPQIVSFFEAIKIPLHELTRNGFHESYSTMLETAFDNLQYKTDRIQSPICWKLTHTYYICYDCARKNMVTPAFCASCFVPQQHSGHHFRLIEDLKNPIYCNCGDHSKFVKDSFCSLHQGIQRKDVRIKQQQGFIEEMQFSIYVFLKITQINGNFTDDSKKKELLGNALATKLIKLGEQSYLNQILIARLLASRFLAIFPDLTSEQKNQSLLALIAKRESYSNFVKILTTLINMLHPVDEMKKLVIQEFFRSITSKHQYLSERNVLSKVADLYLCEEQQIINTINELPSFTVNCQFANCMNKMKIYAQYYIVFTKLLHLDNIKLIEAIFQKTNFVDIADHYMRDAEKHNKQLFYALQCLFLVINTQIFTMIVSSPKKDEILLKIMKDCILYLKGKAKCPCCCVERIFGLAFFIYLDYQVDNIYNIEIEDMLGLFGEEDENQLINLLNKLIFNVFPALKLENRPKESQESINNSRQNGINAILSTDHIYVKILTSLLLKIQQPSIEQSSFRPLSDLITSKRHTINVLLELYSQDEMPKLQETINAIILETISIVKYFVFLAETDLCQIIIRDALKYEKNSKEEVFEIFQFLVYICQPQNIKLFRDEATRYIQKTQLIMEFVEGYYERYHKQALRGVIPQNNFNISFSSPYLSQKGQKEINLMYALKLNKYKRTEISRYIFSYEMLNQLGDLFETIITIYQHNFKRYHDAALQSIKYSIAETLLLLFLETKYDKLQKTLERIFFSGSFAHNQNEQYQKLVRLYRDNKKNEIQAIKVKNSEKSLEQQKKFREKVAIKMNEMRKKQENILQKTLTKQVAQIDVEPTSKTCIICKDSKKEERTYYFTQGRFTNFAKTNQNHRRHKDFGCDPYLLMSTCGHCAHASCIKSQSRKTDIFQSLYASYCYLCQEPFNHLFPVFTEDEQMTHNELSHYVNYFIKFIQLQLDLFDAKRKDQFIKNTSKCSEMLLFKLAMDSIFLYSLQYRKYFILKILPIIKEAVHILYTINIHSQTKYNQSILQKTRLQGSISHLIYQSLACCVQMNSKEQRSNIMDRIVEIFAKHAKNTQDQYNKEQMDRLFIVFKEFSSFKFINFNELTHNYSIHDNYSNFYKLPQDLIDLYKQIGMCPTCKLPTSKILICLSCSFKTCQKCKFHILQHISYHMYSCAFIRVEMGDCLYYFCLDKVAIKYLYVDFVGEQSQTSLCLPKKGQYRLSHVKKLEIQRTVLEDKVAGVILQATEND